jgi:hypothetical protein
MKLPALTLLLLNGLLLSCGGAPSFDSAIPVATSAASTSITSASSSSVADGQNTAGCIVPSGRSHNAGRNCLSCHSLNGNANPIFTLAGTLYKADGSPQTNGKINFYPHTSNMLTGCIVTNNLGNFYTSQSLGNLTNTSTDVGTESAAGGLSFMNSALTSGSCNACHGVTTLRLTAD